MTFPLPTIPPNTGLLLEEGAEPDSSVFRIPQSDVSLVIRDPQLRETVANLLYDAGYRTDDRGGPARLVIFDAEPGLDLCLALASLRADAKSAAPVILLLDQPLKGLDPKDFGVFACVRKPIVADELVAVTASALEAQSVRLQVADLSHRLDLQAHLASIGRISAGLTHELANPLAAATTNLDFIEGHLRTMGGGTSAERRAVAEALTDAGDALERMRSVLRTMQEIARKPSCSLSPVRLADVAEDVRRAAAADKSFSGVAFEVLVDEDVFVLAERTRLTQIVVNLVANGAHAAQELSSPRVRVHVYGAASAAVISVRDNGPGIPKEAEEKIFEPFYTTRRGVGGTGLGLSLCREYALQMNAKISLWSGRGRGSCFRVRLQRA